MKTFKHRIDGDETTINVIERPDDFEPFRAWVEQGRPLVGADTETTGLDTFSPGFKLRTVQLGDAMTAWVLPVETGREIHNLAAWALRRIERLALHSSTYDLLVIDRHLGVSLEELAPKVTDTRILAHLLDPRGRQDGGVGHSLKQLSAVWVDDSAPDTQEGLTKVFNGMGLTKQTGWAAVPIDNPTYLLYAGLDVILTTRLAGKLRPQIKEGGFEGLAEFEHAVSTVCAKMEKRGMLVDREYTARLSEELSAEHEHYSRVAASFGVSSVNATTQVAKALSDMGEELTERTATGAIKVDKDVLLGLADLDFQWNPRETRKPNELADAVIRAKRAAKWKVAYADAIQALSDENSRLHPKINSLQARTARMSISHPPLQQLPSSGWTVRRCFLADPGDVVCSVDFKAVELRVLAALSQDQVMMEAIRAGEDLHSTTARLVFGEVTKHTRKVGKMGNFLTVYGGGAGKLAKSAGIPEEEARQFLSAFARSYRGVKRYSQKLQRRGESGARTLYTVTGRRMPLDRDRLYAALNYNVQSVARDVFAQGLLNLDAAGMTDCLRIPVHDEMVLSAPADSATDVANEVGRLMSMDDFYGVPIETDPEVGGPSWGSLYGCPDDKEYRHSETLHEVRPA